MVEHRLHAGVCFATMAELGDGEEAVLAELKPLHSKLWSGYSESRPGAEVLDILQESTSILRKHSRTLLLLALLLGVPFSSFVLSHILLRVPFVDLMVISLQRNAQAQFGRNYLQASRSRRLAETVISSLVDVPLSALLFQLLKASVGYVVKSTYARKKLKMGAISITLKVLRKHAMALVQTFLWTCGIYFTFAAVAFTTLATLSTASLVVAAAVGIALAAGMAVVIGTCNLACVISVQEEACGRWALAESTRLLHGKMDVALLLFLVTNVNGTLLDVLFEFHVLRNEEAEVVYDKYWEAPLLVGMHAFVHLLDAIMLNVFYFMSKSARDAAQSGWRRDGPHETRHEFVAQSDNPCHEGRLEGSSLNSKLSDRILYRNVSQLTISTIEVSEP